MFVIPFCNDRTNCVLVLLVHTALPSILNWSAFFLVKFFFLPRHFMHYGIAKGLLSMRYITMYVRVFVCLMAWSTLKNCYLIEYAFSKWFARKMFDFFLLFRLCSENIFAYKKLFVFSPADDLTFRYCIAIKCVDSIARRWLLVFSFFLFSSSAWLHILLWTIASYYRRSQTSIFCY